MEQKQSSNFRAIYNAALNQNDIELQAILNRGVSIDETQVDSLSISPASQLAKEGNFKAATWLKNKGANISMITLGAAWGGHREYAEFLRGLGADIDYIALGAAWGGHREYAEFLRGRRADIDYIAIGAAMGGHREYAEFLRRRGADINVIAQGAVRGGHREYAEFLRRRGADINVIAQGAAWGGHVNSSADSQLRFLAFLDAEVISDYVLAFSRLRPPLTILPETQGRAIEMSTYMRRQLLPMSYSQALVRSDYRSEGALYLLMLAEMMPNKLGDFRELPNNVMIHALSFLLPSGMTPGDIDQLGFFMGRAYLGAQLHCYLGSYWIHHRARAQSFFQAVYRTFDIESLKILIVKQGQLLNGNNQYSAEVQEHDHERDVQNPSIDRFNEIIFFWNRCEDEKASSNTLEASAFKNCSIM